MSRRQNPSDNTFLWLALFGIGGYYLYKSGWLSKILAGPSAAGAPAALPPAQQPPVIITRPNTVAAPPPPGIIQQPAATPPVAAATPPPTSFTPGGPLPLTPPPADESAVPSLRFTPGERLPGGLTWSIQTTPAPPSGPLGSEINFQPYPGGPQTVTVGVPFVSPDQGSAVPIDSDPNIYIHPGQLNKTYFDVDGSIKTFHGEELLPPPEIDALTQSWFGGYQKFVAQNWYPLTSGGVWPGWTAYDTTSGKMIASFPSEGDENYLDSVRAGMVVESISPGGAGIIVVWHPKVGAIRVGPWMSIFIRVP